MKYYQRPTEQFFILPNDIFAIGLSPPEFLLYAFLSSSAGSKGYCWPRQKTICAKTGLKLSTMQKALKVLRQRQLVEVSKHHNNTKHRNNVYTLLSLDNPEIYRDLATVEPEELPLFIGGDLPA